MAPKVTSSRNRSTRNASRRPTSSKTRATRSRASTNSSRVTQSGQGVRIGEGARRMTGTNVNTPRGAQGPRLPPVQGPSRPTPTAIGGPQPQPAGTPAPPRPQMTPELAIRNLGQRGLSNPREMLGIGQLLNNLIRSPKQAAAAGALFGLMEGLFPSSTGKGTLEGKPIRQEPQSYSGMQDMSGDPIKPSQPAIPMGRPDPFAPIGYTPPSQPQSAATPLPPSRKQIADEAYDSLRVQLKRGEINTEEFARQGMKIHKDFFGKQ